MLAGRLLFGDVPYLVDMDGVLIKRFTKHHSQFMISTWLFRKGYSKSNLHIPDIRYHGVYEMIRNLGLFS